MGILTGICFLAGLAVLFVLNPQTYEELNNLSLASYNIIGMNSRLWAAIVTYGAAGLFNVLFCFGLLKGNTQWSVSAIGKVLLLICGLIWMSFGIFTYDPTIEIAIHLQMARLIALIIASIVGLLLLGSEYNKEFSGKGLKLFTLLSASLILLFSFLSTFVYNDDTWIRTNASLVIYFVWFFVIGLHIYLRRPLAGSSSNARQ
jgi:hypothetical protein